MFRKIMTSLLVACAAACQTAPPQPRAAANFDDVAALEALNKELEGLLANLDSLNRDIAVALEATRP